MQNDTIKIGICDDSKTDSDYISSLVKKWGKYKNPNIVTFSSAEEFLFNYEEEKDYDILLLDIEMKGMDGVSLAMISPTEVMFRGTFVCYMLDSTSIFKSVYH